MIEYFLVLLAIPLGIITSQATKHEKEIYSKAPYFPLFLWVLAILAAVFLTLDKIIGLTFTFMFLFVLVWMKS